MYRRVFIPAATATIAATALAAAVGAAQAAAPVPTIEGAYLYLDHDTAGNQDFVRVVFRTAKPLPRRRYDDSISAGISIDGVSHSVASARKAASIYTGAAEVKGGSIATWHGGRTMTRMGAKIGRTFTVRFFTRQGPSVAKRLVLRAERKGDDSGRPLVR
ncbi:MAG TPA: hypothetical protein VGF25_04115 [Thermoleophilaceae bacterium]|jgi:hypothetical protein